MRIVCFMTDGYVGNEMEIISEVQKHPNARVFGFGIGGSVNRFLLDKMSEYGRGEVEYVALNDDGSAAARRFHERVRNPLLTDISVDWNGLPVSDVYPQRIPDLFGAKPVILTGRYTAAGRGVIRLRGKMSGREFVREIAVDFPEAEAQHNVLSSLWARQRIDNLMSQDYNGLQRGEMKPELKDTITNLGIEYRLMTQFTSFVAVEEMIVTDGGQPRRIDVPVEVPEGVNREAVDNSRTTLGSLGFSANLAAGNRQKSFAYYRALPASPAPKPTVGGGSKPKSQGGGGGVGSGSGSGSASGRGSSGGAGVAGVASMEIDMDEAAELEKPLSPAEKKRAQLQTKFHPSVLAVVDRLKDKNALAGPDEAKFIRDGKAEIQIWLTEKSPENLAKLKELGFEVVLDPKTAKLVIGRLPLVKLEALAELNFIRYISPQLLSN
jgi:uncharacterized membrane protein YgcG